MRALSWTRVVAFAATGTLALALTGCSGLLPGNSTGQPDSVPGSGEAINVAGTEATLEGNSVSTECFDFTTPDIGADWVLHPEPFDCVADVNWPDADQLTMIRVRAQTGEFSVSAMEDSFRKAGYEDVEGIPSTVDGQDAYTFDLVDGFGLHQTIAIIALPQGRFSVDDVPLTSIFVAGYAMGEGDQDQVRQIVDSIDIH